MKVKIAAAQYPITAQTSFEVWATHTEQWVSNASKNGSQLLIFPEYGAMELVSIFSKEIQSDIKWQVNELNAVKDKFCEVFANLAHQYKTTIIAPSIPVIDNGRKVNRAHVFSAKGLTGYQDKFFMTRFENEEWGIESGEKNLTLFEADWGNFGIQICYDVEFGIGSQLLSAAGATVIAVPSCTETIRGATRVHIGARARALENQIYTAVAQTVGNAAWSPAVDINYGFAAFYSTPDKDLPEEGIISTMMPQLEGWHTTELDLDKLDEVRNNGQVFNFKDQQNIFTFLADQKISISTKQV
ncbi:nitrilase [Dyadobacter luteus]|uniref:Nitrilase n=1 Tax=Dyadobacter luteus TaxID=2259619 RepID=A0A3D8YCX4_9BACT|nr:carbon-nitrogen hydrolase family protein [Dyadobacter luteus]REA62306.1 nitrilase [Dyadobacter luteus]